MKTITRERLLSVIEKIAAIRDAKTDRDREIMQVLAVHGMRAIANGELTELDRDRMKLEDALLGLPRSHEEFSILAKRMYHNIDRYYEKIARVHRVQEKHGISGLEKRQLTLGGASIDYHWGDDRLSIIEPDMRVLSQEKVPLFEFWADYAILTSLNVYRHVDDGWEEASIGVVQALLPLFQWAHVWGAEPHYISPSRLEARGYDECRSQPKYDDDEAIYEVHFCLGNGDWLMESDDSIWFCASNHVPAK